MKRDYFSLDKSQTQGRRTIYEMEMQLILCALKVTREISKPKEKDKIVGWEARIGGQES